MQNQEICIELDTNPRYIAATAVHYEEIMKDSGVAIGRKVSLLAKALDVSQTELANQSGVSRVSLNRFFRGQSELRLSDLVSILEVLGIDLESIIQSKLSAVTGEKSSNLGGLGSEIELILQSMSPLGRRSYLGHLLAHASLMDPKPGMSVIERIETAMDQA